MQPITQTKRDYVRLSPNAHPDDVQAFHRLQDHIYELRGHVATMQGRLDEHEKTMSKPTKNDNLLGLKLKAVTDQTTLVTGNSFKWNAKTAQFELGP